jgi:branched-chain amino acid transport system permease protein
MKKRLAIFPILLIALIGPCFITNTFFMHLLITTMISIILITWLNLLVGLTKQVSLGHAAFYGLGAYTSALLSVDFNLPFLVTASTGILLSILVGALVGFPATRLKGPYLAMTTLGFGQIFQLLMVNLIQITKRPIGVTGIKAAGIFGWVCDSYYKNCPCWTMSPVPKISGIILVFGTVSSAQKILKKSKRKLKPVRKRLWNS